MASLGGSFYSDNIEDYYLTPYDLGYGPMIKFDHDFIGREALEKMAHQPHRKKVTLALDSVDVTHAISTMFEKKGRATYFDFPSGVYSTLPYDKVMRDGKVIGISTWCGYSANEGKMLTLAMLDKEYSDPGTEVTFAWGEEAGGSSKPAVERHVQTEIRAIVSPVPYSELPVCLTRKAGVQLRSEQRFSSVLAWQQHIHSTEVTDVNVCSGPWRVARRLDLETGPQGAAGARP